MKLFLSVFLVLCLCSSTFSLPSQERDASSEAHEGSTEPSVIDDDAKKQDDAEKIQSALDVKEKTETDDSEFSKEITEWKRKFNKRIRNRYNKLNGNKDKGKKWRKRRPSNYKKGASKSKTKTGTEIIPYAIDIRKVNEDVDSLLDLVSQYISEGSGFSFKLTTPPNNIRARPWGYVILENAEATSSNTSQIERVRTKRENDENESDGDSSELDIEEDNEADEENNDEKEEIATPVPEENRDSQAIADKVMEQKEAIPSKEGSHSENDDDDEEEEDDTEPKEENLFNSTRIEQQATAKPSPNPQPIRQADGSIEYHLQLLDDGEVLENQSNLDEPSSFNSRTLGDIRNARKRGKFSRPRNQRQYKRPRAAVYGLEMIKRSEDVTAGLQNGTGINVYEILLDVGSVYLKFNESAVFSIPVSRISTGVLKTRLRLKERDGKLTSLRMKPLKIRPNSVVVSLKVADQKSTFDDETARVVTHLSQEMARAWNSGILIRNVQRSFKQLLLTGLYTDDITVATRNIKAQSEKHLQNIFSSASNQATSSTSSPEISVASDLASTTPLPLA